MTTDRFASTMALDLPVSKVKLISPARAKVLNKLGINTIYDLVTHYPHRYIDMSRLEDIACATIGEMCTIIGEIHEITLKQPKPRLNLVEIGFKDQSGLMMVTCFRQPWLMDTLHEGDQIAISGKVEFNYGFKRMTNPFIEKIEAVSDQSVGRIVPVHHATEKLSTTWMRRLISNALDACQACFDPLPLELREKYRLASRYQSLRSIHFPSHLDDAKQARRRLAYEEVLLLQLHLMMDETLRTSEDEPRDHVIDGIHMQKLIEHIPFTLTEEQIQACNELLQVLAKKSVANHMILGDVGTGKTIVAAFGLAAVADSGTQAAMMAPTEVLANQYGIKLGVLLDKASITWATLTGSTTPDDREEILDRLKRGDLDVIFGTQALLEEDVQFKNCSLVVIDEQQRFGVNQRAALLAKGSAPDALFLTATPIPRTLALALYGNLTLSYIKERPRNMAGNMTKVFDKENRGKAYDGALGALKKGQQVYVVCPLVGVAKKPSDPKSQEAEGITLGPAHDEVFIEIEDDRDLAGENVSAATKEAHYLQNTVFVDYSVGLLHGKMANKDKQETMERFRSGDIQVLVATTVIEVGVDVPNATVMIVEDADRFGLSQLHQLRGRVGRGDIPGEVYLISSTRAPIALERLAAMEKTEDGYELATYDLSLRREGDILGNRQHGASALKLINVVRDGAIIESAHEDARQILETDPCLESDRYKALAREMRRLFDEEDEVKGG